MAFAILDQPALKDVVADAYKVFGRYRAPAAPLDACTHCCMSADLELQMRRMPLRQLTRQHFYEYNTAAKSEVQPVQEIFYFLPRMLELMAEGAEIHHSTELYLDRVGRCPPNSFSEAERTVINGFALAHFANHLKGGSSTTGYRRWLEDPLTLLLMFDIGGVEVQPLLDLWLQCDEPLSTVQYVESTYWHFWEGRELSNAFATERPEFRLQMRQWMLEPSHCMRFLDKLMAPKFQELAALQPDTGHIAFRTMVDAVFDNLTQ